MIFISSNLNCYVAKIADVIIPLPNQEDAKANISAFSSQTAIFYALNVLYACIFKMNYEENITSRELQLKNLIYIFNMIYH